MADNYAPQAIKIKAVGDEIDGHSATLGATTDADTALTVIGRLKKLVALLPTALVGGRLDTNLGAWLGSTAPTVGQKSMANSVPIVLASDQTSIPVTIGPGGTSRLSTLTSAGLAAGASVDLNATEITDTTTGKLLGFTASSSVPLKIELKTVDNATIVTRMVLFTLGGDRFFSWTSPDVDLIAITSVAAQAQNFRVTITNMDNIVAADVYATVMWTEE